MTNKVVPQHTPGPWHVMEYGRPFDSADIYFGYHPGGQTMVSQAIGRLTEQSFGQLPKKADARLIAAAPELLEALRDCEQVLSGSALHNSTCIQTARAAIAKATEAR